MTFLFKVSLRQNRHGKDLQGLHNPELHEQTTHGRLQNLHFAANSAAEIYKLLNFISKLAQDSYGIFNYASNSLADVYAILLQLVVREVIVLNSAITREVNLVSRITRDKDFTSRIVREILLRSKLN